MVVHMLSVRSESIVKLRRPRPERRVWTATAARLSAVWNSMSLFQVRCKSAASKIETEGSNRLARAAQEPTHPARRCEVVHVAANFNTKLDGTAEPKSQSGNSRARVPVCAVHESNCGSKGPDVREGKTDRGAPE